MTRTPRPEDITGTLWRRLRAHPPPGLTSADVDAFFQERHQELVEVLRVALTPAIPAAQVIAHFLSFDGGDDPQAVIDHIRDHRVWARRWVPIERLTWGEPEDPERPEKIERYARLPRETRPPIITLPGLGGRLQVLDGTTRIASALRRGETQIDAYVPESAVGPGAGEIYTDEYVVRHVQKTDGSDDPLWVHQLEGEVRSHPLWERVLVPLGSLAWGDREEAEVDLEEHPDRPDQIARYAALPRESRPAIVAVPGESYGVPGRLHVLDGTRRTTAARRRGETAIEALVPRGSATASGAPRLAEEKRHQALLRNLGIHPGGGKLTPAQAEQALRRAYSEGLDLDAFKGFLLRWGARPGACRTIDAWAPIEIQPPPGGT